MFQLSLIKMTGVFRNLFYFDKIIRFSRAPYAGNGIPKWKREWFAITINMSHKYLEEIIRT